MSSTFHYFAYGSNLLTVRLRERTPSAKVLHVGTLWRHELRWHKAAVDGSGKCDVVPVDTAGSHVRGVVYEILLSEKPALDQAEALGLGYAEKQVDVDIGGAAVSAWAYYALKTDSAAVPYEWYKALVVGGARQHEFEPAYLRALEAVKAKPDTDVLRAARHLALLDT